MDISKVPFFGQTKGVCVLVSYYVVIRLFSEQKRKTAMPSLHEFLKSYIQYEAQKNNLFSRNDFVDFAKEKFDCLGGVSDATSLTTRGGFDALSVGEIEHFDNNSVELLAAIVFHFVCQNINKTSGYKHLIELETWAKQWFEVPSVVLFCDKDNWDEVTIDQKLKESDESMALILSGNDSLHSRVVCYYKEQCYIGDPNVGKFKKEGPEYDEHINRLAKKRGDSFENFHFSFHGCRNISEVIVFRNTNETS